MSKTLVNSYGLHILALHACSKCGAREFVWYTLTLEAKGPRHIDALAAALLRDGLIKKPSEERAAGRSCFYGILTMMRVGGGVYWVRDEAAFNRLKAAVGLRVLGSTCACEDAA